MRKYDLAHFTAPVLVLSVLLFNPLIASGCGWWGDSADEVDEAVVVGPDGTPVEDTETIAPDQMARLSNAYRQGDGVPHDLTLARVWARRAAEAGHVGAMNDLGQMLEAGLGGPMDAMEAARWYREAAWQGNAGAQHSLAVALRQGNGVESDLVAAEGWLRRSAGQGHVSAAKDLSGMIWDGLAAARSPGEGCFWWLVALSQGYEGDAERCRQAQPMLSDKAFRTLQVRAANWKHGRTGNVDEPVEGGS